MPTYVKQYIFLGWQSYLGIISTFEHVFDRLDECIDIPAVKTIDCI